MTYREELIMRAERIKKLADEAAESCRHTLELLQKQEGKL